MPGACRMPLPWRTPSTQFLVTGARIRENVDLAILTARIVREGDFLTLPGSRPAVVRTPVDGFLRKVEHVPDDELMLALANIVHDASGIGYDELTEYVARLYGWSRRGPDISSRLAALISRLRADGVLPGRDGSLPDEGGTGEAQTWLTYGGDTTITRS
jgi:hypothetical protein